VLAWLKRPGKGYQTRSNGILRVGMESQSPRSEHWKSFWPPSYIGPKLGRKSELYFPARGAYDLAWVFTSAKDLTLARYDSTFHALDWVHPSA